MNNVRADDLVWIFGTGRGGSTWLASMMNEMAGGWWDEPLVGKLFGDLYFSEPGTNQADKDDFIYARKHRDSWLRSIRSFVLDAAAVRFPRVPDDGYLIVKEPNGSVGAPLLMEALPESRMIFLVRDPRDVIASNKDARREGGWLAQRHEGSTRPAGNLARRNLNAAVTRRARRYLQSVGKTKQAYEAHQGHKVFVKYEELSADTLGVMRHIHSELDIEVEERDLARSVEKYSWESIPEEEKGAGKFHRKATPGSWREDLTPEQVEIVERETSPLLNELYPQ